MNRWGISKEIEDKVRKRDLSCVYCGIIFDKTMKNRATFEHFDNERWDDILIMHYNIALCCGSCNASKGAKSLEIWLNSEYCKRKNISIETVAECVRDYIRKIKKQQELPLYSLQS